MVLLTAVIVGVLAMRWKLRQAAIGYGLELQSALFERQEPQSADQPRKQRDIFNEPKMLDYDRTLHASWGVVGIDYMERAEELRMGVVYLYTQMSEPPALRFARPPKLRHFTLEAGDKSDLALNRAVRTLMDDYINAVGSR